MKKVKDWLLSSTKNKIIFSCGIIALAAIICVALFFICKKDIKHKHTIDYKYEGLNDGTHKKISYCTDKDGKKCKNFKSKTVTEECEFDEDGICKYCGYSKYVSVKFLSNIDDSVVKEMKVERGTTLDSNKDFPEVPTVEGYEFKEFQGKYDNIEFDTEIILVYKAVDEKKEEETSINEADNINNETTSIINETSNVNSEANNTINETNAVINNEIDNINNETSNTINETTSINNEVNNEEDYSEWNNSSTTPTEPYEDLTENNRKAAEKFQTWLTTDPVVNAFYTEHGFSSFKQLTEGIGGEFDVLLIGADGATQTVHYKE